MVQGSGAGGEAKHAPARERTLLSIHYMRGIAALSVAAIHAICQVIPFPGPAAIQFMRSGVDAAFIISGFVLWRGLMRRPPSPGIFLFRRVARIAPLYWGITSVMLLMMIAAPHLLQTARFDWGHVLASYAFLPWLSPAPGVGFRPLFIPGWTLHFEMFFYVLVAAVMLLPKRVWTIAAVMLLLGLVAAGLMFDRRGIIGFYTDPLLIEFAFGILLAVISMRVRHVPPVVSIGVIIAGIAGLLLFSPYIDADETNRLFFFGVPLALIIGGAVLFERNRPVPQSRLLHMAGDAAYAIYLSHPLLMSALAQAWKIAGLTKAPPFLFIGVALLASLLLGLLAHHAIERPFMRLLRPDKGAPLPSAVPDSDAPLQTLARD